MVKIMFTLTLVAALLTIANLNGQPQADNGPWLPNAEQEKNFALWKETGVPIIAGIKFYKLPRVSQRLSIVNDRWVNAIYDVNYKGNDNPNKKQIWDAPGGLAWSSRDEWRNATAAIFPSPITVFIGMIPVKNSLGYYQNNTVVRWEFPDETIFAELLIHKRNGEEHPFELRVAHKSQGKWERTAYRPYSDEEELPTGAKKATYNVGVYDVGIHDGSFMRQVNVWELPDSKFIPITFKPSKLALAGGYQPKKYAGNIVACAKCHERAGESGDYDGSNAPGNGGVISWHPYTMRTLNTDASPQFDTRWSLNIR